MEYIYHASSYSLPSLTHSLPHTDSKSIPPSSPLMRSYYYTLIVDFGF